MLAKSMGFGAAATIARVSAAGAEAAAAGAAEYAAGADSAGGAQWLGPGMAGCTTEPGYHASAGLHDNASA